MNDSLLIGWTTFDSEVLALRMARDLVEANLAVCVQIDSGVRSIYKWKGEVRIDDEWRLTVKFLQSKSRALSDFIKERHAYDVPEWTVVRLEQVAPAYMKWALRG